MTPRFSLSFKVVILTLINVVLLFALLLIFAQVQFRVSPESFLSVPGQEHVLPVYNDFRYELTSTPPSGRKELVDRFSKNYPGITFHLVDIDGKSVTDPSEQIPEAIAKEIRRRVANAAAGSQPGQRGGNAYRFYQKTENPSLYWLTFRLFPPSGRNVAIQASGEPAYLLLSSDTLLNQYYFDWRPWAAVVLAVMLVSVLVWLPLMRGLTHAVSQMTDATGRIAEGQFDVRLNVRRKDEVGQLAASINQMSSQLDNFVKGQKRFLADIAHELCAPVARMQMALGILEQHADDTQREYVTDVQDEAQHMSTLINELLSFSKAGMQAGETRIVPVPVAETVHRVLEREGVNGATVEASVDGNVQVLANPDYLFRALSNLVRNSIRYAGYAGPISVSARNEGDDTVITVADSGPGLPDTALENIFAPFYRLERSRGRDLGGTGLGLAIVKACVEACKGTVRAQNRKPVGLSVEIRLPTATQAA